MNLDKAVVRVQEIADLGTPYEFQPDHGIISREQSVDIILTDCPGISIHLTLQDRNGATLDIEPQIDTGQGKKVEFTQKRVKQLCMNVIKLNFRRFQAAQAARFR